MTEFKKRIKQVKYFSYWLATETLQKCKLISDKQKEELIDEFLEDLEKLPIEHVTWVEKHKIRKSKLGEMNTIQSSMIFLPEITSLKMKWEAKKSED